MGKIIAMCGLICNDCLAFIATQENDDEKRRKVAEAWSTERERLKPKDINCDGCVDGKKLYEFCLACEVRKCGLERGIENCAYCVEYSCGKLERLWRGFRTVSGAEAKANLDEISSVTR